MESKYSQVRIAAPNVRPYDGSNLFRQAQSLIYWYCTPTYDIVFYILYKHLQANFEFIVDILPRRVIQVF